MPSLVTVTGTRDAAPTPGRRLTAATSDAAVATVTPAAGLLDAAGAIALEVTGVAPGACTIQCAADDATLAVPVTVTAQTPHTLAQDITASDAVAGGAPVVLAWDRATGGVVSDGAGHLMSFTDQLAGAVLTPSGSVTVDADGHIVLAAGASLTMADNPRIDTGTGAAPAVIAIIVIGTHTAAGTRVRYGTGDPSLQGGFRTVVRTDAFGTLQNLVNNRHFDPVGDTSPPAIDPARLVSAWYTATNNYGIGTAEGVESAGFMDGQAVHITAPHRTLTVYGPGTVDGIYVLCAASGADFLAAQMGVWERRGRVVYGTRPPSSKKLAVIDGNSIMYNIWPVLADQTQPTPAWALGRAWDVAGTALTLRTIDALATRFAHVVPYCQAGFRRRKVYVYFEWSNTLSSLTSTADVDTYIGTVNATLDAAKADGAEVVILVEPTYRVEWATDGSDPLFDYLRARYNIGSSSAWVGHADRYVPTFDLYPKSWCTGAPNSRTTDGIHPTTADMQATLAPRMLAQGFSGL